MVFFLLRNAIKTLTQFICLVLRCTQLAEMRAKFYKLMRTLAYTGCFRGNLPYFGRTFLRLN
jgi:hypothetical protein